MSKRVLVTGVSGQVGGAIIAAQHDYPFELIPIDRGAWDMAKNPKNASKIIRDYMPDIVINPAAYTNVDGAEDDRETCYAVNTKAVGRLAMACKKADIPMIHVSTDYVFDGTKKSPYTEQDIPMPLNFYGKSKADGEILLRNTTDKYIILRTSSVFSSSGKNFVTTMRKLGKEFNELKIVNDQQSCPTPAVCIAEVLLKFTREFLAGNSIRWGTYNYCGAPAVSWYEFAEMIFKEKKGCLRPKLIPCTSMDYPTKALRPKNTQLDPTLITEVMNLKICDWRLRL